MHEIIDVLPTNTLTSRGVRMTMIMDVMVENLILISRLKWTMVCRWSSPFVLQVQLTSGRVLKVKLISTTTTTTPIPTATFTVVMVPGLHETRRSPRITTPQSRTRPASEVGTLTMKMSAMNPCVICVRSTEIARRSDPSRTQ